MYIIDDTYFTRELQVPNSSEMSVDGAPDILEQFIDDKCRLFIEELFERSSVVDFETNLDPVTGLLLATATQKWKDLVNGVLYTKDGKDYYWRGLAYTRGAHKVSILAFFTYYHYLEYKLSHTAVVSEVVVKGKNTKGVNSTQKLTKTWNEFVRMYQGINESYSRPYREYIEGVLFTDYTQNNDKSNNVSLCDFLIDNEDVYTGYTRKAFEYKNQFGL